VTTYPFSQTTGTVDTFDEPRGLGTVRADDGAVLAFHCTSIADGSRTIPVGQPVRFTVVAGRLGRWEAADITPLTKL
jgi:cold shock CspA family protein